MEILAKKALVKVNLSVFIRCQNYAAHEIYDKDWYTQANPLLNESLHCLQIKCF